MLIAFGLRVGRRIAEIQRRPTRLRLRRRSAAALAILQDGKPRDTATLLRDGIASGALPASTARDSLYVTLTDYITRVVARDQRPEIVEDPITKAFRETRASLANGKKVIKKMHRYPFVERLLRHWDARHVRYLPGVSETELQRFEDLNDLRLPPEFRACYLATNGVRVPGSPETDDKGYDFWPLHELRRVKGDPLKVYFADFQAGSWSFAFGLDSAKRGAVYIVAGPPIRVATTFEQFVDLYIAEDDSLYPGVWYKRET